MTSLKSFDNNQMNMRFLQSTSSADIYSLGIILLQVAMGVPAMLDLPVKFKTKTLKNEYFVGTPLLGHCENGEIDHHHAGLTIKL